MFCLLIISAAVLAIWYRFFFAVKPDIPPIDDGAAFHSPEFNEEDARLGTGNRAPAGVTDADRKQDYFTVLIIGVDGGTNTDTIMVASYDGVNNEASLISIPRDTLVNVSRKVKKINAAYPAGTLNGGGREGGAAQLKREIKTLIGFIPDYYVIIDLKAFVRIIDTVGGVEIDVPYAMRYHDPVQGLSINISKGLQTLNGTDALKFARYRRGSSTRTISDYDRMENQQAVVKALLEKLINPANILKVREFAEIFSENVHTDLELGHLFWFGEQIVKLRGSGALTTYTLPMRAGGSGSPHWYEYIDRDAALELVNAAINPYHVPIKPEDVDILNSVP
jgi:LCP family protein required for cell wall assembly